MASKNNIAIAAVAIVVITIFYFSQNPPSGVQQYGPGDLGDTIINLFTGSEEPASQEPIVPDYGRTNMCNAYTKNYPTYFAVREAQCGLAGGDWICETEKAGCFDITSWDYIYGCQSASDVQLLKALCSSLGGDWTCTATAVGCEY